MGQSCGRRRSSCCFGDGRSSYRHSSRSHRPRHFGRRRCVATNVDRRERCACSDNATHVHHQGNVGGGRKLADDGVPVRSGVDRSAAGRVRAPHRDHKLLRTRRFCRDRAIDLCVPRVEQRLVRRWLQLPCRPVRPGVRGPLRWRRQINSRRAHRRVQHQLVRCRDDRNLQRCCTVGGVDHRTCTSDCVEVVVVVCQPTRSGDAEGSELQRVEFPYRHIGQLQCDLGSP